MPIGDRVKERREALGMNQVELAKAVKNRGGSLSQGQISSLEAGTVSRPRSLPELAAALRTTVEWLLSENNSAPPPPPERGNNVTVHRENGHPIATAPEPLIVWLSMPSAGQAGETLIYKEQAGVATRPVELAYSKRAFAIKVVDDEAHPRYERRDTLLLDPGTTPAEGDDCFFVRDLTVWPDYRRDDDRAKTEQLASIPPPMALAPMAGITRRLVRIMPEHWVIRRFQVGARDQKLNRLEWQAFHIFGSYNRR